MYREEFEFNQSFWDQNLPALVLASFSFLRSQSLSLAMISICRKGWPQTSNPHVSSFQVLGLEVLTTTSVYGVLGIQSSSLCTLAKHSTSQATSLVPRVSFPMCIVPYQCPAFPWLYPGVRRHFFVSGKSCAYPSTLCYPWGWVQIVSEVVEHNLLSSMRHEFSLPKRPI